VQPPRALLLFAIILVALAGGLASLEYGRLTRGFYSQVVSSEGRGVRERLNIQLSPPLAAQNLTGKLLAQASQTLAPNDAKTLILSVLADEQSLSAVTLSDAQGISAMAIRLQDGFLLFLGSGADGSEGKWQRLDSGMRPQGSADISTISLDAFSSLITRLVKGHLGAWPIWTDTHPLPGRSAASISSIATAGPAGDVYRTLTISFGLDTIWKVLTADQPRSARILLFSQEGFIVGPGASEENDVYSGSMDPLFIPWGKATDPVRTQAMNAWREKGRPLAETFSFTAAGKTWWASLQPLAEEGGKTYVGLALSQEELLGLLLEGRKAPVLIGSGLIVALLLLVVLVVQSRRKSRSLAASFFETEQEIRQLLDKGEGEKLEFKSTLRFNLAAGKPGKEIELAVLKTLTAFMNTDGGVLAVGVDDQGRAMGLDADGFENDDHALRHFSSLFAQHIGVEFLSFATFAIRPIEGCKILLVECRKSKEPVILKSGKDEEFYVRAGPSSRKLNLSEFMRRVTRKDAGE
jgi:hypothetical protein